MKFYLKTKIKTLGVFKETNEKINIKIREKAHKKFVLKVILFFISILLMFTVFNLNN